jgi:hypothetical protein
VYRKQLWTQSQQENPNFFYSPLALLEYGAASFLYELFPSVPSGATGEPNYGNISSFFLEEKIPENWYT